MLYKELKKYQEKAVDELMLKSKLLLDKDLNKRTIIFQSPTGSGKTFMLSQYIKNLIEDQENHDLCFLWVSIGKGELHKQSFDSLKEEFMHFPLVYLLEEEFFGSRRSIDKNEVVVMNWEKLRNKNNKTGEWNNILMKDKETTNFRELIKNTKSAGLKIIMIIDESHSNSTSERALELRDEIVGADLTIEMSATPVLREGQYDEKVVVDPTKVIEQEMIKKEIIINEDIDKIDDDEITSQELVMEVAYHKRLELKKAYKLADVEVNPLVLVQIPTSEAGDDKKEFIESFLASKDITKENGKLSVWLSDEKVNQEKEFLTKNDNDVEFLIFKQAIDTGWDCPRAQILVKFRETKSLIFEIQTVGRILRMPEAKHYMDDNLNRAYIFTNVKSFTVKQENYNPNIIKSVYVEREDIYKPLKLRSYYRNRVDYGDITSSFFDSLNIVFCEYFELDKEKFVAGYANKNKKLLAKKIDIENLENKDDLILNKKIELSLFDYLNTELLKSDDFFKAHLSEDDKERAFENLIKINLNGFAPKRSIPIVKNSLYRWFKQYIGITLYGNGIIFIQNVVLNNYKVFSELFNRAINTYKPIKDEEVKQKIKETEMWDDEWEIAKNRNYNPNTYKDFKFDLSLYKNPRNKKTYLNFDSEVEVAFINFLEENKDKILWWWQNGNEHMSLNFGIKYGDASTFQPDFLIMFKNGKLGIYDTKASGYNEDDNRLKGEALQKYINAEHKRKGKEFLLGGLVIKDGEHFRINSDEKYMPFKSADGVKDSGATYAGQSKGWQYLRF